MGGEALQSFPTKRGVSNYVGHTRCVPCQNLQSWMLCCCKCCCKVMYWGKRGGWHKSKKLAVSDSYAAASEAANSKTCILGFPMQQGVKQQRSIWCFFTCCFVLNPRMQVHAASLAAAYIIRDRKFLLFRQPALYDFEA